MKKRGVSYLDIIFLILIIFGSVYLFAYKQLDNSIPNIIRSIIPYKGLKFEIVDAMEEDSNVVKEYFEEGMSVNDFKNVLNNKPYEIKKNGTYKQINYNFEKQLHYYELEDLYINMNNSDICDVSVIGYSTDGRSIYGIEIGRGNKVLLMDANIHAAEVGGTLILTRFLGEILNNYELGDKDIINALNNVKIAVIPSINPDGYEVFNYGIESIRNKDLWIYQNKDNINFDNIKSNANGVDLNRNFPTQTSGLYYVNKELSKGTSLDKTFAPLTYFNGYTAGSENETRAVMYFMLKHYKNTYAYINVHSQGRVIYAGKPNLSSEFNNKTQAFGKTISNITKYKLHPVSKEKVGEGSDGSATDFMAELANGFVFSSKTGRLTSNKYVNNNPEYKYKYPVVTIETLKDWPRDPKYFKDEYYNIGLKKLFYNFLLSK